MPHLDAEIAALEAQLVQLRKEAAAESAELARANASRPPQLPSDWKPLVVIDKSTDPPTVTHVGWLSPNYIARLIRVMTPAASPPGPASPQGGQP